VAAVCPGGRPVMAGGRDIRQVQRRDEGVEDICDSAADCLGFGQRSRVRLVLEGAAAVELQFSEDWSVGEEVCGCSKSWSSRSVAIVMSLVGSAAPIAAFVAITRRRGDRACTAERSDSGRSAAEDGGRRLFCLAMQSARKGAAENSRRPPLRTRAACRPIALWKAVGAAPFRQGMDHLDPMPSTTRRAGSPSPSRSGVLDRSHEGGHIFRDELHAQGRSKISAAEAPEVFVEVAERWRQSKRLDRGRLRPQGQGRQCPIARQIVVAGDIEASERRRE
jgi:hypothetical protein